MADDDGVEVKVKKKGGKAIENDPFFTTGDAAEQDRNETIEERRLRMTKALLEELQQPTTQNDFFDSL